MLWLGDCKKGYSGFVIGFCTTMEFERSLNSVSIVLVLKRMV